MLQQQKEISQMRRSAQYYRNKIHHHSRRVSHSPSPSPSLLLDESRGASQLPDESELSMGDVSVAEELSESEDHRSLTTPAEDLEHSLHEEYSEDFPTYSPSPEPVLTTTAQPETVTIEQEDEGDRTLTEDGGLLSSQTPVKSKPKIKVSPPAKKSPPTPKTQTTKSHTVKELEKLSTLDPNE